MKFRYFVNHWLLPTSINDQKKQQQILVSLSQLNENHKSTAISIGNTAYDHPNRTVNTKNFMNNNTNKHLQWYHPTIVCCLYYIITISTSILLHDMIVPYFIIVSTVNVNVNSNKYNNNFYNKKTTTNSYQTILGLWFLLYALFILIWRLYYRKETYIIYANTNSNRTTTTTTPLSTSTSNTCTKASVTCRPQYQYIVLYEYCWLCNVTLIIASIGLLSNRMYLIISYLIVIGIDQILWYIDLLCYITLHYCPIGVATYVFKTKNDYTTNNKDIKYIRHSHWSNRITWTHHLWTIPVILSFYVYNHKSINNPPIIHYVSYILSILYLFLHVSLSRYLIPSHIILPKLNITSQSIIQPSSTLQLNSQPIRINHTPMTTTTANNYNDVDSDNNNNNNNNVPEDSVTVATPSPSPPPYEIYYLNINLSYEVYKDVQHLSFLRIPNISLLNSYQYTIALIWRWQCFNTIIYILYYMICN